MISSIFTRSGRPRQETEGKGGSEGGHGAPPHGHRQTYFLTPSSASASSAVFTESACLPSLWSFCASSSLAVACFTFGSAAFIFAAASLPSLIRVGHLKA